MCTSLCDFDKINPTSLNTAGWRNGQTPYCNKDCPRQGICEAFFLFGCFLYIQTFMPNYQAKKREALFYFKQSKHVKACRLQEIRHYNYEKSDLEDRMHPFTLEKTK